METKYVNPFTDFGFKKLFGEEASKPAIIDFLNSLLPADSQIKDLSFKNNEQLGTAIGDRKAIFDIYCDGENGEKFIVELQKAKQDYFRERTIYYSTFPITEQAKQGVDWNFNLKAVYCIGILDFTFNDYGDEADKSLVKHEIKLKNQLGKTFYDKLTYIYLEMPNFKKTEDELVTRLDKWLYFIKYLRDFQSIPQIFSNEVVFLAAFAKAEVAMYSPQERASYDYSQKVYWDLKNVIDSAVNTASKEALAKGIEQGHTQGRAEGLQEGLNQGELNGIRKVAKSMKDSGIDINLITSATGLSLEEIQSL